MEAMLTAEVERHGLVERRRRHTVSRSSRQGARPQHDRLPFQGVDVDAVLSP